jgi:hypothetical protein
MLKTSASMGAILALLFSSSCHAGFKIGQYELGMSNRQAAKLGLAECVDSQDGKTIRCVPTALPDVGATTKYIFFDRDTKKLTTMRVESIRFNPFPPTSKDELWKTAAQRLQAEFEEPLGLQRCGSTKPVIEQVGTTKISTCLDPKTDAYREFKIGYNRLDERGGGHGLHSRAGNTPHVGAVLWMGHNQLIRQQIMRRKRERETEERARERAAELKKFEKGL